MGRITVFVKTRQLAIFTTSQTKQPVRKDALIVNQVPEYLFERPFPWGVGQTAFGGLRERAEELRRLLGQLRQGVDRIVARDSRDVCPGVVSVLARSGASRLARRFNRNGA